MIIQKLLVSDSLIENDVEWSKNWIKWQGKVPISLISINMVPQPVTFNQDYEKIARKEFLDFKTRNPNAYNGTLTYLEEVELLDKISITIKPISFGHTLVLDKNRKDFLSELSQIKGTMAIICLISDRKEKYFLTGRRSQKTKWHYKKWSSVGGLAEFQYFSKGFKGVLFDEIREEVLEDLDLTEIHLVGITGQNGVPWTNFIFHAYIDEININQKLTSNYEFYENVLVWKEKSHLMQLDDEELFGDLKFLKHRAK